MRTHEHQAVTHLVDESVGGGSSERGSGGEGIGWRGHVRCVGGEEERVEGRELLYARRLLLRRKPLSPSYPLPSHRRLRAGRLRLTCKGGGCVICANRSHLHEPRERGDTLCPQKIKSSTRDLPAPQRAPYRSSTSVVSTSRS